jgi:hypothetical protein
MVHSTLREEHVVEEAVPFDIQKAKRREGASSNIIFQSTTPVT